MTSDKPICDGDKATTDVIELNYSDGSKTPECKACKSVGKPTFITGFKSLTLYISTD